MLAQSPNNNYITNEVKLNNNIIINQREAIFE